MRADNASGKTLRHKISTSSAPADFFRAVSLVLFVGLCPLASGAHQSTSDEYDALCRRAEALKATESYRRATVDEKAQLMTQAMLRDAAAPVRETVSALQQAASEKKYSLLIEAVEAEIGRPWSCEALRQL